MQITPIDRTLLGMRDYPPVVRQLRATWQFTRRWPTLPMLVLATLIFAGIFAGWLAPHDPYSGDIQQRHVAPVFIQYEKLSGPFGNQTVEIRKGTSENILGTDHAGRDVFSRMLHGAWLSSQQIRSRFHYRGNCHNGSDYHASYKTINWPTPT